MKAEGRVACEDVKLRSSLTALEIILMYTTLQYVIIVQCPRNVKNFQTICY